MAREPIMKNIQEAFGGGKMKIKCTEDRQEAPSCGKVWKMTPDTPKLRAHPVVDI